MTNSPQPGTSDHGGIEELATLAKAEAGESISRIEAIRGTPRQLWNGKISEPPNFEGFVVIEASGFREKAMVSSVEWYPTETAANAAIMLHCRESHGFIPTPDQVRETNGYVLPEEFPLGNYFMVTQLDKQKFQDFSKGFDKPNSVS